MFGIFFNVCQDECSSVVSRENLISFPEHNVLFEDIGRSVGKVCDTAVGIEGIRQIYHLCISF